ncbi:hypothetical protein [Bacillus thuringiensis]|uniref:hypothetical protein n=1 Tax=Bacillus thuringiensis TaxID=1428 RepID=UPI000BF76C7D|nr:hypothetical protein [Bacillus thuringiensis]PEW27346.1 hypothetical protein CN427_15575 [Bacillus thuringiensis]PFC04821.1 hypothetical protein CN302_03655 [Bacillus thuringiensis]PFP01762.1 hypothetical protein COJ91_25775 [Bacillus thuringiensis]PGN64580.1 hypothetical protein CN961_03410 [Bacillus thuringiensis]PGP42981.1 hypothetical protein CN992_31135 [Bacillus thuringiensis]
MYNNYWNPNQDVMYPNAVPNVDSQYPPNYVSNADSNFYMPIPRDSELRERRIELRATKGTGRQLGNGFERFDWPDITDIFPNEYLTAFMTAEGMQVISGGWAPGGYAPLFAMESYPQPTRLDTWIITALNQAQGNPRKISFYLIAKS